jgi:hypothetical protein
MINGSLETAAEEMLLQKLLFRKQTSLPDLEGNKIEIRQNPEDPAHSFLWIPSIKTLQEVFLFL